jgi:hypothetical protein
MEVNLRARLRIVAPLSGSNPQIRHLSLRRQVSSAHEADEILRQLEEKGWRVFRPGRKKVKAVFANEAPPKKCCASCGCDKLKQGFSSQNWSSNQPTCRLCTSSRKDAEQLAAKKRKQQALVAFVLPLPRPKLKVRRVDPVRVGRIMEMESFASLLCLLTSRWRVRALEEKARSAQKKLNARQREEEKRKAARVSEQWSVAAKTQEPVLERSTVSTITDVPLFLLQAHQEYIRSQHRG